MMTWFQSQASSDEGDAVLISVVMVFPLIVLLLGWSVDFSKNVMLRSDYDNIAQEAVQTAIRYQDGVGNVYCKGTDWMDYPTAVKYVNKYATSSDGSGSAAAIASYMVKTGRADKSTFSTSASKKYVYDADSDSNTVKAFRSMSQASDSTDSSYPNYFAIKITCSNVDSSGTTTRGVSGKTDMVNLQVQDWTMNMFLMLPTSNNGTVPSGGIGTDITQVQKFNIDKSAISSYSSSSLAS